MLKLNSTPVRILITVLCSVIIAYSISFISEKINFLERFTLAVTDIDFSDLYYHNRPAPRPDTNIVIVNIGYVDRAGLAQMVKIIAANNPRVIGVDVFFGQNNDSTNILGTLSLADAFKSNNISVLASAYKGKDEDGRDIVEEPSPLIKSHVIQSMVNFNIATDDPEMGTVRSFNPVTEVNGTGQIAFGFSVASFWDKDLATELGEEDMFIRWYGYGQRNEVPDSLIVFKTLDWHHILNNDFRREDIQDKIVLLGFLGNTTDAIYSPREKFYSPLNGKMIGRALPDIYGVEVHANIIKMIIDDEFIYHSTTSDFIINYSVVVVLVIVLMWLNRRYGKQYSILSKVALIIFIDLLAFGAVEAFFQTNGGLKILIGNGLFVMLFVPDTFEFLQTNFFRKRKVREPLSEPIPIT